MGAPADPYVKKFGSQRVKNLRHALAQRVAKEFPRIGGPRIQLACADLIVEVLDAHLRPRDHVRHGQILWMGVSVDDPPALNKPLSQTHLVPVVLDVCNDEDVEAVIQRVSPDERLARRCVRLCRQAYEQGALLSGSDLAMIFHAAVSRIAHVLADYERRTEEIVPRRATLHDVGSGMTHKRIICLKRFREGKTSERIAAETHHSLDAVDRYLGQYDRVRHCRLQGMDERQTAFTLNCSPGLVRQYLDIDDELQNSEERP